MNQHKNEVHLAGILTRDAELRYTQKGTPVAKLSILTKYKDWSEYHRAVAWEGLAEKAAKFQKGQFVKVVGRLQTRSWDDKQSGQKKYSTEVVIWNLSDGTTEKNVHGVDVGDHDIPF